ncbi:MAG TPA: P-loop NTPase fold protein, partial [Alphaproteobacteria bacterium]|nr:P-loop NTPase fold protein [Alphaproteobacteria bacterium]
MADSRKTTEAFDPARAAQGFGPSGESLKPRPEAQSVAAGSASGESMVGSPDVRVAGRRNWSRLWRRLLPLLLAWVPALIVGGYFSLQPLGGSLPDPLGWALTPLSANSFSACRAEAATPAPDVPAAPAAPSKASLLIPSANAQEATPTEAPNAAPGVEQPQQQPAPQEQGPLDSGSTGGGFSAPFDIAPPIGCGELGFGDLADVALDQSGQSAWVINRYGPLYHSADGGRTWERQALPDLPAGIVLSAIAADDAGRQLVVAARDASFRFTLYRSDTGGQSWRAAPEMLLVEQKGGPPLREIGGLAIGAERAATPGNTGGIYVVANIIGDGPEVLPAVWRDSAAAWTIGYDGLDAEMIHRLRGHDFGIFGLDLGATGPATPPIPAWERWQGDAALRFSLQARDPKDAAGALTGDLTPSVEYLVGAGALRGLAASDDGQVVFGAETHAILRGDSRDESWTRITLPAAAGADVALGAIDVANGAQAIMAVGRNALFVSQDGGASFFQPALSRYPAPWFYLLLLSGPLFAFFVVRPGAPETVIVDADESKGLSDRALGLKDADALNLRAYAEGLSNLLRNAETKPPLVVGITGPWGSGKSSVMQMLSELLGQRQMPVVWFNAWHHQSEEHLLASLLSNIRRQGIPGIFTRPGLRLRWRLTLQKLRPHEPIGGFLTSWLLLLLGVALLSGSLALWLAPPVPAGSIPEDGKAQAETASASTETPAQSEARSAVAAIQGIVCDDDNKDCNQLIEAGANLLLSLKLGAVITLLLGLVPLNRLKQVGLITRNFDPAKLMTSVLPASRNPKLDEQLSFRHGFGEELRATIAALAPYRLVIFIDDLDRCRPENVAAVLEAVNFVVSSADCYVVLGMDRAYVLRAIRQEFEKFIAMEREERVDPGLDSPEDDKGRPRDFAEHYLEKLVNLIVSVPKMTPEARSRLMDALASRPPRLEDPAPRFDWQRWLRRSTAAAAILAALLGPALYVASFSPPVE